VDEAHRAGRSGSQKRERSKKLEIALTPDEFADVKARAMKAGLSASSWGYALIFGNPGPRARRTPHIHAEALARATAALNKIGSNFNQIAHALNAAGSLGMGQKYADALDEVRLTLRVIREAVGRTEHSNDNQGE
jgi:hypothetical protein